MGIFNGKAEYIEDNRKKVTNLSDVESPQDELEKYPSVYAVRTGVLNPIFEDLAAEEERLEKIETDLAQHILPSVDIANEAIPQLFEQKIDVAEANQIFANAIKGKESGYAVALNDVSPIEHNVKVKVKRKNLLPYPYAAVVSANGITWTDNGDGTVSAVGTTTDYSQFWLIETNFFESGKSYVWTTHSSVELILLYNDSNGEAKIAESGITWQDTYTFKRMYLQVPKNQTVDATAYPIVVEGTVIDNYWEPYIADLTQVNVEVLGKNILPPVSWGTYQKNGLNFERREDGGIVVNGTSTATVVINFPKPTLKHGTSYAISLNHNREGITENSGLFLAYTNPEGTTVRLKGSHAGRETVLWKKEYTLSSVGLQIDVNTTLNNFVFYPQIEIGETITDYEPYVEPVQYTPNADGTVDGVASTNSSMTLQIDTDGATVEAEYNKDTNKVIEKLTQAIISLGGNV